MRFLDVLFFDVDIKSNFLKLFSSKTIALKALHVQRLSFDFDSYALNGIFILIQHSCYCLFVGLVKLLKIFFISIGYYVFQFNHKF